MHLGRYDSVAVLWSAAKVVCVPGNSDMHDVRPRPEQFANVERVLYPLVTSCEVLRHDKMKQIVVVGSGKGMGLVPRYPLQKPPSRGLEGSRGEGGGRR